MLCVVIIFVCYFNAYVIIIEDFNDKIHQHARRCYSLYVKMKCNLVFYEIIGYDVTYYNYMGVG